MGFRWAVALLALVSCESACSLGASRSSCNSFEIIPPTIRVKNAANGDEICDATITITSAPQGSHAAGTTLSASNCGYGGPLDIAGDYALSISKPGFHDATAVATVQTHSCNEDGPIPTTDQTSIALVPN